jgi:hypothetical protein
LDRFFASGSEMRILQGPNFDLTAPSDRWDHCHFHEQGRVQAAQRWAQTLFDGNYRQ